ncbi:alanine:cation symporter family protein [Escherichia coli]
MTGIILAVFALLAITRGLHGVARLMQGFVPLMAIIWVLTSLVICVMNIGQLPHVIWSIFESAFGWQEAAGGAAGYTLSQAITNGFQRSMFSNEAGMGSTPNAAAAAACAPTASGSARDCPDDWHFYRHPGHLYGKRHADITGG